MSKKEKKQRMNNILAEDIVLDIPDDEVYTYHIEGLAAPHINKPYKHYTLKKIIFVAVIIVAVSLSMLFSLMILSNETFTFKENDAGGVTFTKFSNPGYIDELTINWELDIIYPEDKDPLQQNFITVTDAPEKAPEIPVKTKEDFIAYQKYTLLKEQENQQKNAKKIPYFEITENKDVPITEISPYAFNGDGYIKTIYIGENVLKIDGKSFYSCWALQRIIVDENNPNYCDIDGVLYTKDKSRVICYPCDRDQYLREKHGYPRELWRWLPEENKVPLADEKVYEEIFNEYKELVMTYTVPSTVVTVGELCFNYSNLATVYLPEGLKEIERLGFYEMPNMKDFYTYQSETAVEETDYAAVKELKYYISLPDGLETIGNDAFSCNKEMEYIFIPASVTSIGHHAFWDTAYKKDDGIGGIQAIYVERTKEEFKYKKLDGTDPETGMELYDGVDTGDDWVPIYNYNILKKIPVEYGAERKTLE